MKNSRSGQAAIISDADYVKIRSRVRDKKYRLLIDIARYTGERWGAIVQLKVSDVFNESGKPLETITFRATTRKASPTGERKTRQVPVHPQLEEILLAYQPDNTHQWMFESCIRRGAPITLRMADLMFREAIATAGLDHKGYSTHSTRRTFITRLWEKGIDIHTIQLITGHTDLKSLIRYIQADPDRIKKALALL